MIGVTWVTHVDISANNLFQWPGEPQLTQCEVSDGSGGKIVTDGECDLLDSGDQVVSAQIARVNTLKQVEINTAAELLDLTLRMSCGARAGDSERIIS
jgi:hypothetical protein